jgi:two-component system sensor histidine kinase YesM
MILAVPLAWLYLRRNFFYPLNALVATMEKIKKGDLAAQPDDTYKSLEFNQVNETFNSMIQEITKLKIDSYERKLSAERAELNALKMQIRPHFFLNCLKSLYALAEAKRMQDIQKTILCLADHLRYVFTNTNDMVPLEKELQLCVNYVELQNISKVIPMQCKLDVDANLMQFPVPPVSLLTFVENSVKYGICENQPLIIQICVRQLAMEEGNLVNITLGDNGPGFPKELLADINQNKEDVQVQVHVGLANTIRRFSIIYGREFAYAFTNKNGAKIDLFIPDKKEDTNETVDC